MKRLILVWFWTFTATTCICIAFLMRPLWPYVVDVLRALMPLWVGLLVASGAAVTVASLTRCRKCGGWHDSAEDEKRCTGVKR